MWFLLRAGMYGARSRGRQQSGPQRQYGSWTPVIVVALLAIGIYLMVKHPSAGIAVIGALLFLAMFGVIAGVGRKQALPRKAGPVKARKASLDAQMRQWDEQDAARKAQHKAAFAALNQYAPKH